MSDWCPCGDPECDGNGGQPPASPPPAATASRQPFPGEIDTAMRDGHIAALEAEVAALRAERDEQKRQADRIFEVLQIKEAALAALRERALATAKNWETQAVIRAEDHAVLMRCAAALRAMVKP